MKNTLRILLLEDDLDECNALHDAIDMHEDLILTKATNNMNIALNCVKEIMPEVIILDLELHKGYGSGLEFLNLLHDENLVLPSYILVTTNNISTITHELVRKLGADFIMLKSQDNYSAKYVIQFILTLKPMLINNRIALQTKGIENPYDNEKRTQKRILIELDRIGIAPNAIGRKYLIDSILLIIDGQRDVMYHFLSNKYHKTKPSIERAMQNAIEKAWRTSDIDDLTMYYTAHIQASKGIPTIMEFLYYYAEKVKQTYE